MTRILAVVMLVLTVLLVGAGFVSAGGASRNSDTPEAVVRSLYDHVRSRDFDGAYKYVAAASNTDESSFAKEIGGSNGSLRTFSTLQELNTTVLRENDNEAMVRANTRWSSAVGGRYETRDLRLIKENGQWKVVWPAEKIANVPPQVIPVTYLRWDIVHSSGGDDWGAQDVAAPNVRIISMNARCPNAGR